MYVSLNSSSVVYSGKYRPQVLLADQLPRGESCSTWNFKLWTWISGLALFLPPPASFFCPFSALCFIFYTLLPPLFLPSCTHLPQTLMVQVWYPMTVCTNSRAQKEIIAKVRTLEVPPPLLFRLVSPPTLSSVRRV